MAVSGPLQLMELMADLEEGTWVLKPPFRAAMLSALHNPSSENEVLRIQLQKVDPEKFRTDKQLAKAVTKLMREVLGVQLGTVVKQPWAQYTKAAAKDNSLPEVPPWWPENYEWTGKDWSTNMPRRCKEWLQGVAAQLVAARCKQLEDADAAAAAATATGGAGQGGSGGSTSSV